MIQRLRRWWRRTNNPIALLDSYAEGDGNTTQKLMAGQIRNILKKNPDLWRKIQ